MCVGAQRRARARVTDEIRASIIDHVINHGLSYREAGERVQPNLSRDTVASIFLNISRNQQVGYCMRASPTAKCTFYHVLQ